MGTNILKRVIGWAGIIYFIHSIYLYTGVFIGGFISSTEYSSGFNIGWAIGYIIAITFKVLAILTIYLWQKRKVNFKSK